MSFYNKKEYFIKARHRFIERAFVLKAFCITFNTIRIPVTVEDLEEGSLSYVGPEIPNTVAYDQVYLTNDKEEYYGFIESFGPLNDKFVYNIQILQAVNNKPLFSPLDTFTIKIGDIENYFEKEVSLTNYGQYFFNYVLFVFPFGTKIPYIHKTFSASAIQQMVIEKLIKGVISINEKKNYDRAIFIYGQLSEICVPTVSLKSLTTSPEVRKLRDKLIEENKDKLDNPIIAKMIQDKIIQADKDYIKGDSSELFYKSRGSSAYNIQRAKMVLNIGGIPSFSDDVGNLSYIPKSLVEGYDKHHIDTLANETFKGSYTRGVETQLGGEQTNIIIRMFQGSNIEIDDCGSTKGIPFKITKENVQSFDGMYEAITNRIISADNYDKFIGKRIVIRSPETCKAGPGSVYCKKCFGRLYEIRGTKSLEMDGVDCTSTLMLLSMKNMHGTELKTMNFDFRNYLVSKL